MESNTDGSVKPEIPTTEPPIAEQPSSTSESVSEQATITAKSAPAENSASTTTESTSTEESTLAPLDTQLEEPPVKKPNKPLLITLICLLSASIIAVIVLLIMFPPNGMNGNGEGGGSDKSSNEQTSDNTDVEFDNLGELSDFDLAFLKLENDGKNTIYSPLSIKYALAMLSDATDGESYNQIYNLIGDYTPKTYTNSEHRSFANAMFIRDTIKEHILSSYTDGIKTKYDASLVFDPFSSPDPLNLWISDKTLGIINNMFDETVIEKSDFILANALAIDMDWKYELQCNPSNEIECLPKNIYNVKYSHENFSHYIRFIDELSWFDTIDFNGQEIEAAEIGASANRYDIISELGEDYIRSTVLAAYDKWLEKNKDNPDRELHPESYPENYDIDEYMEGLASNYGKHDSSTDFYFNNTENEKVFAKDLKEYDGSTLQYVGIMPKEDGLSTYIESLTAKKLGKIIAELKDVSEINSYKEGVVTKINAHIPFFDFNKELDFVKDLKKLGVVDVFDRDDANLTKLTNVPKSYIKYAIHKANIDFSNEGIKAAAATAFAGGLGNAFGGFEYKWDVPVEEIDLTFDKPFLFLIRDKATGEVWFTGAFYNTAS